MATGGQNEDRHGKTEASENDRRVFRRAERVRIVKREVDVVKRLHVAEACRWNPLMENCIGLVGVVSRKTGFGHYRVVVFAKSEEGKISQRKFSWHPACLAHCGDYRFAQGRFVYICDDQEMLNQQNRNWNGDEEKCHKVAGKTGQVSEVSFGEIMVSLDGRSDIVGIAQSSLVPIYDASLVDDMRLSKEFQTSRFGDPNIVCSYRALGGSGTTPSAEQIQLFLAAAKQGNEKFLAEFIHIFRHHVDCSLPTEKVTALMYAAAEGRNNIVHILCLSGASPNGRDGRGMTPLHYAVMGDKSVTAQILIGYGADVRAKAENDAATSLHWAVAQDSLECFKILIDNPSTEINAQRAVGGETVTHACIQRGKDAMLEYLLSKRADEVDYSIVTSRGFNIMHWAALHGNAIVVRHCLEKTPTLVNVQKSDGTTPLHCASQNGHGEIVEVLLGYGNARVDLTDRDGQTPLHYAIRFWKTNTRHLIGRLTTIWTLIKAEADLNAREAEEGRTPLHEAMKTMEWMLEGGAPFPAQLVVELQGLDWKHMHDMEHLVQVCSDYAQLAVVLYMLAMGADLDAKDKSGKKPTDLFPDPKFQYLWKHFRDAYQENRAKKNTEGGKAVCLKCGRAADVLFHPCGHTHCCGQCARIVAFRFCACGEPVEKMTAPDGSVIKALSTGEDVVQENMALRRRLEEAENAVLCPICMDRKCNMFFNCGHMVCNECGAPEKLHSCHNCRTVIKKRNLVFPQW